MKMKKLFSILLALVFILLLIIFLIFFPNFENNPIETSHINWDKTITVTPKDTLHYFEFYPIYGYRTRIMEEEAFDTIYYNVLYNFKENFPNFIIHSNEISLTEDLFINYNVLLFLTLSDYSLKLDTEGIQFQNDQEEFMTLHLIEDVHRNYYYDGNSNPMYMAPQYFGGIILLPKQYILQEIQFDIKPADHSKQYVCEKFHSIEFDSIFSHTTLTPSLATKHNFQQHDNRHLYQNNL